jgi:ABC-type branched-subunit amino acid transport system substrate-binding protein
MLGVKHRRILFLVGLMIALALILAACGGDEETTTTESTAATETTAAPETTEPPAPVDAKTILLSALGREDATPEELGSGQEWNIGATLSLSGPGATSAALEKNGIELALKHIADAGGPAITVEYGDNATGGDPDAAANANTNLNQKGIGVKLSDFADGLGAGFPTIAQYQILTIDAAAGTGTGPGVGYDLYWGARALTPFDGMPGIMAYVAATMPDAKTMAVIANDAGPANEFNQTYFKAQAESVGMELTFVEFVPYGAQDFSAVITKIQAEMPDVIVLDLHFAEPGTFYRQALNAGLDTSGVFGTDMNGPSIESSQGAFDQAPYVYAGDFAPELQSSPLSLFVQDEYEAAYGTPIDDQAARYYQATLMLWELYMRTVAAGGDVNSGADVQAAIVEDPTFPSLWGGSDETVGTFTLDETKHWVTSYPLGVYSFQSGENTLLATYDITIDEQGIRTAKDFQLAQ